MTDSEEKIFSDLCIDDMKKLNTLSKIAYQEAKNKGWYAKPETDFGSSISNLHEEVSELWKAYRSQTLKTPCDKAE